MTLFAAAALAIVVAAFATRVYVVDTTQQLVVENNRLAAAIAPLKQRTEEVDTLRKQIEDLLARGQVIEVLASTTNPAAEVLAELSRLPRSIVLTLVQINGSRLSVSGNANTENDVHDMEVHFQTAWLIRNARIRKLDALRAQGGYAPDAHAFEIEMEIKP